MTEVFFFQAENDVRYMGVTGVQACALPICPPQRQLVRDGLRELEFLDDLGRGLAAVDPRLAAAGHDPPRVRPVSAEIGRASCRERVQISVVAVSLKNT